MTIKQAMILAAGHGTRMRPLTDDRPKPMVEVRGKPIIDYALDSLAQLGIETCIVNTHYKAEVLQSHLIARDLPYNFVVSHEPDLLDTGGGIKQALRYLDINQPLMVLSGDSILEGDATLPDLAAAWNGDVMDIILLLQPLSTMVLTPGVGDYTVDNGIPARSLDRSGDYMWTSARILNPAIFLDTPDGAFSFLPLMDNAQKHRRLGAHINTGIWHHLTTPDDVAQVEAGA